jgi:hypothetical protein
MAIPRHRGEVDRNRLHAPLEFDDGIASMKPRMMMREIPPVAWSGGDCRVEPVTGAIRVAR